MSTLKDQFAAEEAWMAKAEANLAKEKVVLARLWKEAQEEVRWKVEEEQRWKEEEERAAEEWKQKGNIGRRRSVSDR